MKRDSIILTAKTVAGILGLVAVLISCGGNVTTGPDVGSDDPAAKIIDNPIVLGYGETVTIIPDSVEITFDTVLGDSRCPSDVVCIWEGMATIGLRLVQVPADTHYISLSIRASHDLRKDTLGFRLNLMELAPYPISTVPRNDSNYVATISVFRHPPLDSIDGEIAITDRPPSVLQETAFQLDSVRIDNDILRLTVVYGGGCAEHQFELLMSPSGFAESLPVQASVYLRHVADDPCDAVIRRELAFDLRPVAHHFQIAYGHRDCMVLNVHQYSDDQSFDEWASVTYHPDGAQLTSWCNSQGIVAGVE